MLDEPDAPPPYEIEDRPAEKSPMPGSLRSLAEAAIKRHQRRPAAPDIVSKPNQREKDPTLECPYADADEELWWALLLECFGTRIHAVGAAFLGQLADLCPEVIYDGERHQRADEEKLRQALAIVYSLKPRNEAEAALAAQLVAVHFAAMKVGAHLGRNAGYSYTDARTAASLAALVKAYSSGLGTMQNLKGGRRTPRQTIKVEKHVTLRNEYHDNRTVVVPAGGGAGKFGTQTHGRDELRARATPLVPGEDEGGRLLQIPSREGPEALPTPRRR